MNKFIALTAAATFALGVNGSFAADAEAGATVFKKCAACHNVEEAKNKVGPHLVNVIGRTPGTLEGFKYSNGMVAFGEGKVWDEATLTEYLANPRGVVKGTRMAFAGLKKEEELADVIAYLKTFSEEMPKTE
ncbi:MAG: cytochrome c family protein [Ahrensia sp.]